MIRKKVLIWAIAILLGLPTFAQFSVSFSGGYAIPIYNKFFRETTRPPVLSYYSETGVAYEYSDGSRELHGTPVHYALVTGLNTDFLFGYKLKPWLNISTGLFYLNNKYLPYKKRTQYGTLISNEVSLYYAYYLTDRLAYTYYIQKKAFLQIINPLIEIELIKSIKKIELSTYFRIGFSFYKLTKEYSEKLFSSHEDDRGYFYTKKIYFNSAFRGQLGLRIKYNISDKFSIFTSVAYLGYNFSPSKGIVEINDKIEYIDRGEYRTYENTTDINFTDWSSIYYEPKFTYYGKSLNYSLGIRYSFGKKQKKEEKNE